MKSPLSFIFHILDEIYFIENTVRQNNLSKDRFLSDEGLKRAFARSIEIVGEAVKNLPAEFCHRYPDIPWRLIAGMRDRLIHGYFSVDYELVWDVANTHLMSLKEQLQEIIESKGKET